MFKRKYYVITADEENIGLRLYYWGRFSKPEAIQKAEELNKTFPLLFLVISGRGLRELAHNSIQYSAQDISQLASDVIASAQPKPLAASLPTTKKKDLVN